MVDAADLLRERRVRDRFFSNRLFYEPAWDMMLDLHAHCARGQMVAISSLCIAANVPPTTALRHISRLLASGLIERHPDPADQRRTFIALTDHGRDSMDDYLAAIERPNRPTLVADRAPALIARIRTALAQLETAVHA